jgi:excisionase family DNA binding protein
VGGEVRYYTLEDAARMLRLPPERVRQMLEDGELEGTRTGDTGGWRVPIPDDLRRTAPPVQASPGPPPAERAPERAPSEATPAEDRGSAEESPSPIAAPAEAENLPEGAGEPDLPAAELEEARQPAELPRGGGAAISPEITSESGWATTQQAARALGISARTVRWHIDRGNLDAKPEGEGVERAWRVSIDSLQAFRDSRQRQGQSPRDYRAPAQAAEIAAEDPGDAIRALADRLVEEARRAEAARVRLELAERAQSTLEAELAEERRRREEAERAREGTERELEELRKRLEAESGRAEGVESEASPVLPAPSEAEQSREVAPRAPETPAQGFGTDAAGGGPQRQASPQLRWWSRWRRR